MSTQDARATLDAYMQELLARGDYRRFFADDVVVEIEWSDQRVQGAEAAEQAIRYLHEVAFDAQPELTGVLVDGDRGAAEAVFAGTHIGEFAGVPATGKAIRVPYSVFYDFEGGAISALRIYMPLSEVLGQIGSAATADVPA
jgi:steroid delta-isomerase-like uncharacterized protein